MGWTYRLALISSLVKQECLVGGQAGEVLGRDADNSIFIFVAEASIRQDLSHSKPICELYILSQRHDG